MKTRKILAASTAALLSFGAVSVVAFAGAGVDLSVEANYAKAPNSLKIGDDKNVVGPAINVDSDGAAVDAEKDYFAGLTDDDKVEGDLATGLKASMDVKDAKKLKGKWALKGEFVEVPENDDEKVAVDEDEIKDLGLSDENKKILAKTGVGDVKIVKITLGKDDKTTGSITKSLKITVKETFAGAKVYHVNSDGSVTLIKSDTTEAFDDGKKETTFSTTQFSPFIITTATLKATAASTDDSSDADSDTSGAASTNPETGIALAIAPVVLAAGAVAVVALKKKH